MASVGVIVRVKIYGWAMTWR